MQSVPPAALRYDSCGQSFTTRIYGAVIRISCLECISPDSGLMVPPPASSRRFWHRSQHPAGDRNADPNPSLQSLSFYPRYLSSPRSVVLSFSFFYRNLEMLTTSQESGLLSLPYELLSDIATQLLVVQNGEVVGCYHLAAFSLTCRQIYYTTRSLLFKNVIISSEAQLESLSHAPECLLENIW